MIKKTTSAPEFAENRREISRTTFQHEENDFPTTGEESSPLIDQNQPSTSKPYEFVWMPNFPYVCDNVSAEKVGCFYSFAIIIYIYIDMVLCIYCREMSLIPSTSVLEAKTILCQPKMTTT